LPRSRLRDGHYQRPRQGPLFDTGLHTSLAIGTDGLGLISLAGGGNATFHLAGVVGTAPGVSNWAYYLPQQYVYDPVPANDRLSAVALAEEPTRAYVVPPCRVADTRSISWPKLAANSTRFFRVAGACGVPADAQSVAVNLTAVNPGAAGHFRLYPAFWPVPLASALNFVPGRTRANNAIVALGENGDVEVQCDMPLFEGFAASTHFVMDVFGYFK
jgi:hypothetical protein